MGFANQYFLYPHLPASDNPSHEFNRHTSGEIRGKIAKDKQEYPYF